ncbi:ATP-grasp fold amidoligase family protein [Serratia marcescens]|uniref:ATP-grasp fold amidoligase family protein n=1 Tax=Serratia marcescens TaxID=615 RepID=UPI0023616F90|nr:ATP-grasp fold amidoligase family protein [Serratia marcescens]
MSIRDCIKKISKTLPWYVQDFCVYTLKFGRFPNIKNPKTFNEKVLYRKNFKMNVPLFIELADKYRVRRYIEANIGREYLIPLLFVTEDPEELKKFNWTTNSVIVKPNHGAGMYKIIHPPVSATELNDILAVSRRWMQTDFSHVQREIHYRYISPLILVEKLLGDGIVALTDYKFHLFKKDDGDFDFVLQIINDRFSGSLTRHFYVNNFEKTFEQSESQNTCVALDLRNLELALSLSKKLAQDFNYVRIDWYIYHGKLYFGEITFTPVAGFGTGYGKSLDHFMGTLWREWR